MNDFVVNAMTALYDIAAFAGMILLIHVIRQATNDLHLRRTDPVWVIRARKLAFFCDAAFLLLTICFQEYWLQHPSVVSVGIVATGLVAGGAWILAVNVISLRMRAPPGGHQTGARIPTGTVVARSVSKIFHKFIH